jgi:uncharacterized protein
VSAKEGHLEIVKILVKAGAQIDRQDDNWKSALIWSTKMGHLEIVKFLIEAGADMDLQD